MLSCSQGNQTQGQMTCQAMWPSLVLQGAKAATLHALDKLMKLPNDATQWIARKPSCMAGVKQNKQVMRRTVSLLLLLHGSKEVLAATPYAVVTLVRLLKEPTKLIAGGPTVNASLPYKGHQGQYSREEQF